MTHLWYSMDTDAHYTTRSPERLVNTANKVHQITRDRKPDWNIPHAELHMQKGQKRLVLENSEIQDDHWTVGRKNVSTYIPRSSEYTLCRWTVPDKGTQDILE